MAAHGETFRLPFSGTWFVAQGGDTINVNHHMRVPSQRFGIDFAKVAGDSGRSLTKPPGKILADYYSWGQTVLAPVAGTIIELEAALPDNPIGIHNTQHVLGNHVVIKTSDGDFVFLAHLQKNSVLVKLGAEIKSGQPIGQCGNSGNSDFPHIHLHVQNTPDLANGIGKNITFTNINVELSGKKLTHVDWPLIRGLFVSQAD